MLNPRERDEFTIKKFEELYALSKSELDREITRFSHVEEKATRHFSLLVVLLSFVAIGVPEYVAIVKSLNNLWRWLFLFVYPLLTMCVECSIFFYMRSIDFQWFGQMTLDDAMYEHFKGNRYVDVIFSLSKLNTELVKTNRAITEMKLDRANIAYRFAFGCLILVFVAIVLYVTIKLQ